MIVRRAPRMFSARTSAMRRKSATSFSPAMTSVGAEISPSRPAMSGRCSDGGELRRGAAHSIKERVLEPDLVDRVARAVRTDRIHESLDVRRRLIPVRESRQCGVHKSEGKDAVRIVQRELKRYPASHRQP